MPGQWAGCRQQGLQRHAGALACRGVGTLQVCIRVSDRCLRDGQCFRRIGCPQPALPSFRVSALGVKGLGSVWPGKRAHQAHERVDRVQVALAGGHVQRRLACAVGHRHIAAQLHQRRNRAHLLAKRSEMRTSPLYTGPVPVSAYGQRPPCAPACSAQTGADGRGASCILMVSGKHTLLACCDLNVHLCLQGPLMPRATSAWTQMPCCARQDIAATAR